MQTTLAKKFWDIKSQGKNDIKIRLLYLTVSNPVWYRPDLQPKVKVQKLSQIVGTFYLMNGALFLQEDRINGFKKYVHRFLGEVFKQQKLYFELEQWIHIDSAKKYVKNKGIPTKYKAICLIMHSIIQCKFHSPDMLKVNNKITRTTSNVVLMFLLLTLNIFYTFFLVFLPLTSNN